MFSVCTIDVARRAQKEEGTIFVAGINETITENDLRQHFQKYGKVNYVCVKGNPGTSYAFVKE